MLRLVRAFVGEEVRRQRGPGGIPLPPGEWSAGMPIGKGGLGLDSLEQMGALAALTEAFAVDPARLAPASPGTIGDWLTLAKTASGGPAHLVLATSGSTGAPRLHRHAMADLLAEAAWIGKLYADRKRILALVPARHIYGLIWTVMLPDVLGIPVLDAQVGAGLRLAPGDLIVAVPQQWQALARLFPTFPAGVVGASAAGLLDATLGEGLLDGGLAGLSDVYGASETGGIAIRELPSTAYRLMPRWRMGNGPDGVHLIAADGAVVPAPDHLERLDDDTLRLGARRDGAVQVAGVNVWPAQVAKELREVGGVADVAVRLGGNGRLKAFVVPVDEDAADRLVERLDRQAAARLRDVERPTAYRFGPELPRSPVGKLTDWD